MREGEAVKAQRESLGIRQREFYQLCGFSAARGCAFETGRELRPEKLARIHRTLDNLRAVKSHHIGVSINMNDLQFIRKEIRRLNPKAVPVKQFLCSAEIRLWAEQHGFTDMEVAGIFQLQPWILHAKVLSAPCQRFSKAVMAAVDQVLAENPLALFLERYSTRNAAICAVADLTWQILFREVGRQKLLDYMGALILTSESCRVPH